MKKRFLRGRLFLSKIKVYGADEIKRCGEELRVWCVTNDIPFQFYYTQKEDTMGFEFEIEQKTRAMCNSVLKLLKNKIKGLLKCNISNDLVVFGESLY